MGILYLVSTPIGNLKDITLRARKVLVEVDIIACEDTRKTGMLLKNLAISAPNEVRPPDRSDLVVKKPRLISYYEENESRRIPQIVKFLKEGKNVALVSNAGTPLIADPGFKLVRECIKERIKVESIPGTSAIITALACSGLPTDKFLFLGYLPKKQGKRQKILKNLTTMNHIMVATTIIFVSPHRLIKVLLDIKKIFGDIEVVICRELTKMHEKIRREKISQSISYFEKVRPKGEFTLLFHPPI